ncbi:rCG51501 [Rattus norvegicus]|uniref:RCG51501 n=1 Tax=Rattus norvegicus TaxID=10116 RepID=A6IYW8_RAT|nr:rCG51501 [Rattus norvegicus]
MSLYTSAIRSCSSTRMNENRLWRTKALLSSLQRPTAEVPDIIGMCFSIHI